MRKQHGVLMIWTLLCALSIPTIADRIELINGDRLSGTVVTMTDGVVVLKSDLAGEIKLEMSNIKSIQTDTSVQLEYADGTMAEEALTVDTDLTYLNAVNPPEPEKPRWKGEISAGAVYSRVPIYTYLH